MLYVRSIDYMSTDKGDTEESIVDYVIENEGNKVKCKVRSVKVRIFGEQVNKLTSKYAIHHLLYKSKNGKKLNNLTNLPVNLLTCQPVNPLTCQPVHQEILQCDHPPHPNRSKYVLQHTINKKPSKNFVSPPKTSTFAMLQRKRKKSAKKVAKKLHQVSG